MGRQFTHEEAATTFGRIGVKVWMNRGEALPEAVKAEGEPERVN